MLYLAHITEQIANDDQYVEICKIAEKENVPMYIIIKEGVNWDKYSKFNWRKTYFYQHTYEMQQALFDILRDYKMYAGVLCLKN
jgi:hypothetical protein